MARTAAASSLVQPDVVGRRRVTIALVIGLGSVVGSAVVGTAAYRASRASTERALGRQSLSQARTLANHVTRHVEEAKTAVTEAAVLEEIERLWAESEPQHAGCYLCVVGPSGHLRLHTDSLRRVGTDVGDLPLVGTGAANVAEALRRRADGTAVIRSQRGDRQLVGYAFLEPIEALVLVHMPAEVVAGELRAGDLPWAVGLAGIVGILMPLSLGLLHYSYRGSERSLLRATGRLRASQHTMSTLLGNLPGYSYRCLNDPDWTLKFISDGVLELTGYAADEYLVDRSITCGEKTHPDDRDRVWQAVQKALEAGEPFELEYRIIHRSGAIRWLWERGRGTYDDDGELLFIDGFVSDITQQKRAESSQRRFQEILGATTDFVAIADDQGQAQFVNHAGRIMVGLSETEDIAGLSIPDFHAPGSARRIMREGLREARRDGVWMSETVFRHRDGHEIPTLQVLIAHRSPDGEIEYYSTIARDISELKRNERRQRTMMRELDHRVRNSLNSLETLIGLTARSSDDLPGFAESIAARVRAMASVHELLSSSHWEPLSVGSLIAALTPPGCTGCVFTRGGPIQVPAAHGTALGMVIHELLTNSVKHGALGSPEGSVHIEWRAEGEPTRYAFTWRERGGPPILVPPSPGLGTRLVQGLVRSDLRGSLELGYPRDGAEHRFTVQLEPNAETRVTVGAGSAHDAGS